MTIIKSRTIIGGAVIAGAMLFASAAFAADPAVDSMRPLSGPTATAPSEAFRSFQRDIDRAPSLTERFGLPRVSGPIPPILPPARQQPAFDTPDNAWPPAISRSRRPGDPDD